MRRTATMDADILIRYMRENHNHLQPLTVKHMGGEPTMHPRFTDILKESVQHFNQADVFTNGWNMLDLMNDPDILLLHQRNKINFTINGFAFDQEKFSEYQKYLKHVKIHSVIPLEGLTEFYERVFKLVEIREKAFIMLSPDTQINLFDDELVDKYRATWVKALDTIIPVLLANKVYFAFDHCMPKCFFTDEIRNQLTERFQQMIPGFTTCCSQIAVGLIQANFDVYHCNQTQIKIGSMLDKKGNPKTYPELLEMAHQGRLMKFRSMKKISDRCRECPDLNTCRAGCYYNHLLKEK
jgi:radical SAM protein with 4Fe4S-binding SPASM domain